MNQYFCLQTSPGCWFSLLFYLNQTDIKISFTRLWLQSVETSLLHYCPKSTLFFLAWMSCLLNDKAQQVYRSCCKTPAAASEEPLPAAEMSMQVQQGLTLPFQSKGLFSPFFIVYKSWTAVKYLWAHSACRKCSNTPLFVRGLSWVKSGVCLSGKWCLLFSSDTRKPDTS